MRKLQYNKTYYHSMQMLFHVFINVIEIRYICKCITSRYEPST